MNGFGIFIPYNSVPIKGYFVNGIRIDINKNLNNSRKNDNK